MCKQVVLAFIMLLVILLLDGCNDNLSATTENDLYRQMPVTEDISYNIREQENTYESAVSQLNWDS